jgi:hypothetical protein
MAVLKLNVIDLCLVAMFFLSSMCFTYLTGKYEGMKAGAALYNKILSDSLGLVKNVAGIDDIDLEADDGKSDDT